MNGWFLTIRDAYERLVLNNAKWTLAIVLAVTAVVALNVTDFELDASADSLVIEGDPDYRAFREISERYGASNFLILTFTPEKPLFDPESLKYLIDIRDEIRALDRVSSVVTVMDVPLLSNPPVPLTQLVSNIKSLETPGVDIAMAKDELANSPLYVNMLLNLEHNTTALQINFPNDAVAESLLKTRQSILDARKQDVLSEADMEKLDSINQLIRTRNKELTQDFSADIKQIRGIMANHPSGAVMHLGGVPMLADDIMNFVRKDLVIFGAGVLGFLLLTLTVIFRQVKWVILPLITCGIVVIFMMGMLGKLHWQVTVISSNFISLLLILTLSMTIHLVVRYRELITRHTNLPQIELVRNTLRNIFVPCLYMALTTGVAFISLIVSGIRPVINFGLMMTSGIVVAFVIVFTLFPAMMMLAGRDKRVNAVDTRASLTGFFADLTLKHGRKIIVASVLIASVTVLGISKLVVENAFIDYFAKDTEIYQGMSVIDQRLGGTTPLEILIDFPGTGIEVRTKEVVPTAELTEENLFVDEDFFGGMENAGQFEDDILTTDDPGKYWFTPDKMALIKKAHRYLESKPGIGKVVSVATMIEMAERFNDGQPLTDVQLALLYSVIPEEFRKLVVYPYVDLETGQARLNARVLDSMPGLNRNQLLTEIQAELAAVLEIPEERYQLAGMMVLYNNMLQSLYKSQITTLGTVFLGIFMMFMVLFRSWKISVIAMAPNVLAAALVLGVMGLSGIPLDMMTITIASITIGIAVDNTIHYIVRFRQEFGRDHDYRATLKRSHNTIGRAMFYTSLTIIIGFSILVLSNFKPTIYFGALTALAMLVALVGSLTLLPQLLVVVKPFGSGAAAGYRQNPKQHTLPGM